jgi:DNA-binding response OmpR family regulator
MSLSIVHLEDEYLLRDIFQTTVEAYDPQVNLKQFADSDSLMAYLGTALNPIDLIVVDIRVPGSLNGIGVVKALHDWGYNGAIIITSAYRRPDKDLFCALACEWAPKPWIPGEIIAKIQQIVDAKAGVHQ